MIAIPDFGAGAMENWGLITYRETAMLYQPGVSSEGNKQRVAVVVSHELAHQVIGMINAGEKSMIQIYLLIYLSINCFTITSTRKVSLLIHKTHSTN